MTVLVTMAAIILEGETKTGIIMDEHIADASVAAKEVLKKLQASTEEVLVFPSLSLSACPMLISNDPPWMPAVSVLLTGRLLMTGPLIGKIQDL